MHGFVGHIQLLSGAHRQAQSTVQNNNFILLSWQVLQLQLDMSLCKRAKSNPIRVSGELTKCVQEDFKKGFLQKYLHTYGRHKPSALAKRRLNFVQTIASLEGAMNGADPEQEEFSL